MSWRFLSCAVLFVTCLLTANVTAAKLVIVAGVVLLLRRPGTPKFYQQETATPLAERTSASLRLVDEYMSLSVEQFFRKAVAETSQRWAKVIREAGIKAN